MPKKYGPAYGKTAKKAIASMIASGSAIKVSPVKKSRKPKVSNNVKAYVKKAIDNEIEDKMETLTVFTVGGSSTTGRIVGYGINNQTSFTGITSANSIIPILAAGTSVDTRLGNKVTVKSFYVRYHVYAVNQHPVVNPVFGVPFIVCVLFYSRKDSRTNNTNDTLMEFGNSTTALVNTSDLTLKFNKDLYNIHGFYKHKLYPSQAVDGSGNTSAIAGVSGFAPAAMKTVKIKLPSKLIYDDGTTQPTNSRIYASVGVFNIDNSKYIPSTSFRANIEMSSHLVYQDA